MYAHTLFFANEILHQNILRKNTKNWQYA